jgi:hypothetical protein
MRCAEIRQLQLVLKYVVNRYRSQNRVIGGGKIKSNSLTSIPLKDLFFTLLV